MARVVSTYRLQFHKNFPLRAALQLVPYLKRLGVSHIYASPLLQTRAGSMHGYDVIDPARLNDELGTEEDLNALCAKLHELGMGLILDIVPNHMALSGENAWWFDVLRHGAPSRFAQFFDLPGLQGAGEAARIVVPVLGTPVAELIKKGELTIVLSERGLMIKYWDLLLPLALRSYEPILKNYCERLTRAGDSQANALCGKFETWRQRLAELGSRKSAGDESALQLSDEEAYEIDAIHKELHAAVEQQAREYGAEGALFQQVQDEMNGNGEALKRILAEQFYELTDFKSGLARINYRRFFDVNELGGLRVEEPHVFAATHGKIFEWAAQGKLDGLRVDHIDGLAQPTEYLHELAKELKARAPDAAGYVIVEKILTGNETLPGAWPVAGTTGYETIHALRPVQVTAQGLSEIEKIYREFTGRKESFAEVLLAQKRRVLSYLFEAETSSLAAQLAGLAGEAKNILSMEAARTALVEFTAQLPVYRTYLTGDEAFAEDLKLLHQTYEKAGQALADEGRAALDFFRRVLLGEDAAEEQKPAWLAFVRRWQQYTGPAMAKGLEDTVFYIHMPLLPLNEVGSGPEVAGLELAALHAHNLEKRAHHPQGMNALSTHDTKRSEDARARLSVLSEIPARWREKLWAWHAQNLPFKTKLNEREVPDYNEEYMLYQTLLGELALGGETPRIVERMRQFATKALREAKVHTSWYEVNAEYEQGVINFIERLLGVDNEAVLEEIREFERGLAFYGALNALGQVVLKNTMPGVPDTFQGQEMFDFSLVDPDNRHQVNFAMRARLLEEMLEAEADLRDLMHTWRDGRIKLFVTQRTLAARAARPDLFLAGDYQALAAEEECAEHVFAFARRWENQWALVCVPRQLVGLTGVGEWPLGAKVWGGTRLRLPERAPAAWQNIFSGVRSVAYAHPAGPGLPLAELFAGFPVAVLVSG